MASKSGPIAVVVEYRICSLCGVEKFETDFNLDSSRKGGFQSKCRTCEREHKQKLCADGWHQRVDARPPFVNAPDPDDRCSRCGHEAWRHWIRTLRQVADSNGALAAETAHDSVELRETLAETKTERDRLRAALGEVHELAAGEETAVGETAGIQLSEDNFIIKIANISHAALTQTPTATDEETETSDDAR